MKIALCFIIMTTTKNKLLSYILGAIICILGYVSCGTKEIAIMSPIMLLLIDWFFIAQGDLKKIKKFESACRPLRSAASLPIPDQSNPIQSNLIQPCLLYHRSIRVIPGTRTKKTVYVACCAWRPRALRVPP